MLDMLIHRHFTKELEGTKKSVFDLFKWKKVDVTLTNYSTGEIINDYKDLEFPVEYSQSACDIIATKYFRKKGVPNKAGMETSMKDITNRMVSFWVESLLDEGLINEQNKNIVYDELVYMMLAQMWAPNSPQWFNTGLNLTYGINSKKQGHFYYDEKKEEVVESQDAYSRTQGSACFIISVEDSLVGDKSLTDQVTTETLLFKYGSGVGTNWSVIRGKGEPLSGGGNSSGLLSFLKVSDRNAGAIKSGGTTRRAAKMNILNVEHPEIEDYIMWKAKEEDKAVALGKMGYSTSIDGEAYDTVSGQNANNSVRISNSFMSVIDDENKSWGLKGVISDRVNRKISPKELFDKISYAAWRCGDPGVQYDDIINNWHTCPSGEDGNYNAQYNRINASNPCSEYMFLDDTACNLASINIMKFYEVEKDEFDIEGYLHCIKMCQLVLESTIHKGQFPTKDIARRSYLFRTTGLGLTNMGMMFMCMAIPYDSVEARVIGASLTSIMTGYSYYISSLMAEKIGPFKCYDINKEHMLRVVKNHGKIARYNGDEPLENLSYTPVKINHEILIKDEYTNISEALKDVWKKAIESGNKHGFRNAQVSVLAPTGTIAFAMDCATTSSEPFFSHVAFKKLVGGSFMEIVNPAIPTALKKLGYNSSEIDEIVEFVLRKKDGMLIDGNIENAPHLKSEHLAIFDTANACGTGQRFIEPEGHVKMMGALTPCVTGAISKTVNMPSSATVEDVKNIYKLSWDLGIKAIALYRDGCKAGQPLNTKMHKERNLEDLTYHELLDIAKDASKGSRKPLRIKPSGIRTAHVHEANINGLKLYITTSFYDTGRLGEVYVSSGRQGSLTKGLLDSLSTTISEMLQYNVPAKDIASMYRGQKYEPSGFVTGHPYIKYVDSISDLISKIIDIELGNYEYCQVKPDMYEEKSIEEKAREAMTKEYTYKDFLQGEICSNCKSNKLVKNGTCKVCTVCGTTTGCS
ncbi:MAG: vitamin B12-dependent ribonucleotide reductase [Lachnospirales bacterium]